MNNIWFTSDTHWAHSNICMGVSKWDNKEKSCRNLAHSNICMGVSKWDNKEKSCRNFQTLEEMNDMIVENINKYVDVDDTLYHLGDWSFGGVNNIWEFRKQIKCKNIILVLGNHDDNIKKNKQLLNCNLYDYFAWKHSELKTNLSSVNEFIHSQDLFLKIIPQCYKIVIDKQELILSHYPLEEWENMPHGSIHLHGHSHHTKDYTDLNMYAKRMDVGIDWEEFRPYSWEDIREKMNERKINKHYE